MGPIWATAGNGSCPEPFPNLLNRTKYHEMPNWYDTLEKCQEVDFPAMGLPGVGIVPRLWDYRCRTVYVLSFLSMHKRPVAQARESLSDLCVVRLHHIFDGLS